MFIRINGVIRRLGLLVALAAVVAASLVPGANGAKATQCAQSSAQVIAMRNGLAPALLVPGARAMGCPQSVRATAPFGSAKAATAPIATGNGFDWADAGVGAGVSFGAILLALTGAVMVHRHAGSVHSRA